MTDSNVPIIAIDGPSGTGKGTIARLMADALGFHLLDSGALYRLLGLAARRQNVSLDDPAALAALAERIDIRFEPDPVGGETRVVLDGDYVTDLIRTEDAGRDASVVAAIGPVRAALLGRQRAFARAPGLVADGRDMGTVVFPAAQLKIFLTASLEERARRRYKQLRGKGIAATLDALSRELAERDARDSARAVAPLRPAPDAILVDTTGLGIDEVLQRVRALWDGRCR